MFKPALAEDAHSGEKKMVKAVSRCYLSEKNDKQIKDC